jgi:hypothetical protein
LVQAVHTQRRLMPILCMTAYEGASQKECVNVENSPSALIDAIKLAVRASLGMPN